MLVLSGDVPLISAETIAALLEAHESSEAAATMLTIELDDPGAYGRVVRDCRRLGRAGGRGESRRRRRRLAAGDPRDQRRHLRLRRRAAGGRAAGLSNDNAQGEYYLPDVFPALREAGHSVAAHLADDLAVTMGVNNRVDLAAVEAEGRRRLLEAHMLAGVTVVDPASTWIDAGVEIAADARIEPGTSLRGATEIGAGAVGRPAQHPDRQLGRRRLPGPPLLPGRVRGPRRLLGRPLRLPAPRRLLEDGRQGRHLRRDQELARRRGHQGPAPRLRRRRRHRPRQQPRRRHDHRQLRRIPQEPDGDRPRRPHRR